MHAAPPLAFLLALLLAALAGCTAAPAEPAAPPDAGSVSEAPEPPPAAAPDHPIDRALALVDANLSEQQRGSEVYAYAYAALWYDELDEIIRAVDDRNSGLGSLYQDRDYPLRQARSAIAYGDREETPAVLLFALGDFYRSEALRLGAVAAAGGQPPFFADEAEIVERLCGYDYELHDEWSALSPLLLAAAVPQDEIRLFAAAPFGMLLEIGSTRTLLPKFPPISPRGILPQMIVRDLDGDGDDEIVIAHTCKTGAGLTGISADNLYVIEYDAATGAVAQVCEFTSDDLAERVEAALTLDTPAESGALRLRCGEQAVELKTPEYPTVDGSYGVWVGNNVRYDLARDPVGIDMFAIVTTVYIKEDGGTHHGLADSARCTAELRYENNGWPRFAVEQIAIAPYDD